MDLPYPLTDISKLIGHNIVVSQRNGESTKGLLESVQINSVFIRLDDSTRVIALNSIDSVLKSL